MHHSGLHNVHPTYLKIHTSSAYLLRLWLTVMFDIVPTIEFATLRHFPYGSRSRLPVLCVPVLITEFTRVILYNVLEMCYNGFWNCVLVIESRNCVLRNKPFRNTMHKCSQMHLNISKISDYSLVSRPTRNV